MSTVHLTHQRLLRLGQAKNAVLNDWREGASICNDSGLTINQLVLHVAADRWKLAYEHRRDGNRLMAMPVPPFRSAISRYYYAMYHSMRAAAFVYYDGDDHESHSNLPTHVPDDFPNVATWKNTLKNARLTRNAADYDPYPRRVAHWRKRALAIQSDADALLLETKQYLVAKGCNRLS